MSRKKLGFILLSIFVLWIIMIFYFSSQPPDISNNQSGAVVRFIGKINDVFDITDTRSYIKLEELVKNIWLMGNYKTPNAVVRKSAHFGIYFILGILCSGLGYVYSKKLLIGFLLGVSLSVTIAVLDEFNQGFIGRTSSLNDVIIDGAGALLGTMLLISIIVIVRGIMQVRIKK